MNRRDVVEWAGKPLNSSGPVVWKIGLAAHREGGIMGSLPKRRQPSAKTVGGKKL